VFCRQGRWCMVHFRVVDLVLSCPGEACYD
jgi:hypothetical protein